MKWSFLFTFILGLFLIVSCAHQDRNPAQEKTRWRHIVFDIDWTIVTEVKSEALHKRIVDVQGTRYFVNEGLEDFVSEILTHPELRVSFFSGGKRGRNEELLSKIKLRDGRSLRDIAFKILSSEDLIEIPSAPPGARFAQRFKKDLTKVSIDLSELIMFDDTIDFVLETQERQTENVFFTGISFEYFENFSKAKNLSGPYVPKSYEQWLINQKKLIILHGAFKEAYKEVQEGRLTLVEALKEKEGMLKLNEHAWNEHSSRYFKAMGGKPPILPKLSKELSSDCYQGMKVLMGL